MAPGASIVSGCDGATCWTTSGTSVAAPHVSGAAALLLEEFPNLSAAEVVQILMTTALDLGEEGPDPIFGMGLVDLAAAIAPIGDMEMATSGGATMSLNEGGIKISAAFGDALTTSPTAQATFSNILAADSYDRTYTVNFSDILTAIPNQRFDLARPIRGGLAFE